MKARLSAKFFIMKISFHSYANKTNFHMKSFALSLAFIMKFTVTRKWPISKVNVCNLVPRVSRLHVKRRDPGKEVGHCAVNISCKFCVYYCVIVYNLLC